jgi:hypothetical protein
LFAVICATLVAIAVTVAAIAAQQQPLPPVTVKRMTGQSIVPVFEGWERNDDGSFNMVFGYLNRNYGESIVVDVGASNKFEPGEADRGQPTFFYPRRQQFLFRVKVPADWGTKDLTWTLVVNGKTEKAYASLKPVWELSRAVLVDNLHGNDNINLANQDKPPTLTLDHVATTVTAPATITLSGKVHDADSIPPPPPPRRASGLAVGRSDSTEAPPFINVPAAPVWRFPAGLSAGWLLYRGPAEITLEPSGYHAVTNGTFVTKATFTTPGTYVLRAVASDSMLETKQDVTITVAPAKP